MLSIYMLLIHIHFLFWSFARLVRNSPAFSQPGTEIDLATAITAERHCVRMFEGEFDLAGGTAVERHEIGYDSALPGPLELDLSLDFLPDLSLEDLPSALPSAAFFSSLARLL